MASQPVSRGSKDSTLAQCQLLLTVMSVTYDSVSGGGAARSRPSPRAVLQLLKPITWFAPMWAFACGVVSSGAPLSERWGLALAGALLAGPLVCAMSQAANDWCDRHVDAINEPDRPIPSGRIPGRWGLYIAHAWTVLSLIVAAALGPWVLGATALAILAAWAYSAPPLRFKRFGWLGAATVAFSYEGLAWFTGAAAALGGAPDLPALALAALYSIGAVGIMPLNDFKALEGDRRMGVASLPAQLGPDRAARVCCVVIAGAQVWVIALLVIWGAPFHAAAVGGLLALQFWLMSRLLADPLGRAPWFNATGTGAYVVGMMISAAAVGGL